MDNKWEVELYENAKGEKPVEKFFESLSIKANLKVERALELLETFGIEGGYPHVKKVICTNLWEYRILGTDSIRIFYIAIAVKTFLVLHGFKKKKQKTPTKEIKIAQNRLQEYISKSKKN